MFCGAANGLLGRSRKTDGIIGTGVVTVGTTGFIPDEGGIIFNGVVVSTAALAPVLDLGSNRA
jgi:hypothetical protein